MKKVFGLIVVIALALGCRKDKISSHVFWMKNEKALELKEKGIDSVMVVFDTKNGLTSDLLFTKKGFDLAPDCGVDDAVTFDINLRKYSGKYEFQIRSLDTVKLILNIDSEGCFKHEVYGADSN
jgi:hypothetical protein